MNYKDLDMNLGEVLDNLGLTYIYETKADVIKGKVINYYELVATDLGFRLKDDSNLFISMDYAPGQMFQIGYDEELEEMAIDFKSFKELIKENHGKFNPKKFYKEYDILLGRCYIYDEENQKFERITDEEFLKKKKTSKQVKSTISFSKMNKEVKKSVIAQDEQIKQVLTSIYKNQKIINSSLNDNTKAKLKENIIVYGPTGTGKTEILKQVADLCGVPIVIEDITNFSETGYVGRDISEMLYDLYTEADYHLENAERGILVIDEFDKVASGGVFGNVDGPSREGVQRSLLKLLDGGTISFLEDGFGSDQINFDTTNLTVVALGAFTGIKKNDDYSDVSAKDFTEYGIMREVMGRFSKFIMMNRLKENDLKKILLESELSPLITHQKLFEVLGVKFTYDDEVIDYIVDEAIALDMGARSLKTIFDELINDDLCDVLDEKKFEIHLTVPKDKSKSQVAKQKAYKNRKKVGFA